MGLSVFKKSNKDNALTNTPLGIGNGFKVALYHNAYYNAKSLYWRIPTIQGFTGIMLDNLALNFQTSWGDAGGAVIGKKIESYMNSKFIKFLAGQSDQGFQPFICSDAWTQQKVSGEAQPIKVQLKFKAYNIDKFGCTNYNDIIKFLIHICSPIKSSSKKNNATITNPKGEGLGDDVIKSLESSIEGGGNLIGTFVSGAKDLGNSLKENENAGITDAVRELVNTADKTYNTLVASTGNGKNNANFTVNFALGNVKETDKSKYNYSNKIIERGITINGLKGAPSSINIDWIIKSFNFKPSRQFEMVREDANLWLPKPLWMDFDLTLETRFSLSNKYVYNVIIPKALS